MKTMNIDWRPLVLVALALLFLAPRGPYLPVALLALGAWLAVRVGLAAWRRAEGQAAGTKVTYWRGRRIEMPRPGGTPRPRVVGQRLLAALCLALGVWLGAAALLAVARLVAG